MEDINQGSQEGDIVLEVGTILEEDIVQVEGIILEEGTALVEGIALVEDIILEEDIVLEAIVQGVDIILEEGNFTIIIVKEILIIKGIIQVGDMIDYC